MTQKTVLTELIEKMKEAKENFPALGFDEEFVMGFNKAFQMAEFIAKSKLPKERQDLIDAYSQGVIDMASDIDKVDYKKYVHEKFGI